MNKLYILVSIIFILLSSCKNKTAKELGTTIHDSSTTVSAKLENEWVMFRYEKWHLQFEYPNRYKIRITENHDLDKRDSVIVIGYMQKMLADTIEPFHFVEIAMFYCTKKPFTQIANNEGFENAFDGSSLFNDSTRSHWTPSPLDWLTDDGMGFSWQADFLKWNDWLGLKGRKTTSIHNKKTGYSGRDSYEKYFLYRTRRDGSRIIASYKFGCWLSFDDDPQDSELPLSEVEFEKIIKSAKLADIDNNN